MLVEEGTYISNHKGELLNSKNEWHQAKIIRTTTRVVQGGADVLRGGRGEPQVDGVRGRGDGDVGQPQGTRTTRSGPRPWGQ